MTQAYKFPFITRAPCVPLVLGLLVIFVSGVSVQSAENKIPENAKAVLENADRFELLSLAPERQQEKSKGEFDGWTVLGKTLIPDAEGRRRLLAALEKGIKEHDGPVAACFNPRHGVRATHQGKAADLVICFECVQGQVYVAGKREGGFLTTRSPEPVFDRALRDAKVPLGPRPN